jgi:FG-GAP-like repeat
MTTVFADAYGFNATDATAALQAAIDSPGVDKIIVRNQGTPWLINSTIRLRSNQEIRFEQDVVVKAKSGSFLDNNYSLFQALGISNIKLIGEGVGARQATLAMNKSEFSDSNPNAYSHIIGIEGTDNFTISGLTLTGAGGDGIIVDAYSYGQPIPVPNTLNYSDRGLIDNVTAIDNRRNGLSVISAQNLTVTNSKFINSSGTSPATGIDFEPDFSYNRLSNINVSNVDLSGNQGNGLSFILSALDNNSTPTSININGATANNNEATGLKVGMYSTTAQPNSNAASSTPNGVINISNVTIAGTKETNSFDNEPNAAISIQALSGDLSDPNNLKVNFSNIAISNTGFNTANPALSANPIFIRGFGGPTNRNQIGNLSFDNVTVADNFNRDIIGIKLNQPGSFNNISGNIRGINPNGVTADITSTATQNNFTLTVTPAISPVAGTSGNDTYVVNRTLGGGTIINDSAGNDTLTLTGGAITTSDISRSGTSIIVDLNGDRLFEPAKDLSINNFFANANSNQAGSGLIENVFSLSGTTILNLYAPTPTNSDGDSKSDILWRNDNGNVARWNMNGNNVLSTSLTSIPSVDPSWKISSTADFSGDSKSDILWRNDNGNVALWNMNGNNVLSADLTSIGSVDNSWKIAGTGDFSGDGKSDILWRNDNGSVALWNMNGNNVLSANLTSIPSVDVSWKVAGTGDFSGDGKSDILWRNDNGSVALWNINGNNVLSANLTSIPSVDVSWKVAGSADFSGDGKADILWRNDNGSVALWKMDGNNVLSADLTSISAAATSWKISGTTDFSGDSKADILWRNDTGATAIWEMDGATVLSTGLTSIPLVDPSWKIAAPIL